jgi:hypothetical protein
MIVTGTEIFPFKTKFPLIKGLFKTGFTGYINFTVIEHYIK